MYERVKVMGTETYWEHQCRMLKLLLKQEETEETLHKEKTEKIRARLAVANTYLHNFQKATRSN